MDITVSQAEGRVPVTVFKPKGHLSEETDLREQGQAAYDAGTRNLLLDLSDVDFISSAGLRGIHYLYLLLHEDAHEKSVKQGIVAGTYKAPHLKLANPSPAALKALRVAGYDMFLEVSKDYKTALKSFG